MSPLVTIISPTYNHEKQIGACIESVLRQTFPGWEMVVINDGSTDNTAQIVEQYSKIDDRIKLYNQKNLGIFRLAETYNRALQVANGKYIAVLEGDDLWVPAKLERQVRIMDGDDSLVLAWGMAQTLNESTGTLGPPIPLSVRPDLFNNDPPGTILNSLFFENPITAATILMRKDELLAIGGFQQSFNLPLVDLPTIFELVSKGRFYFDQHVLSYWRVSSIQITKKYPVEILKGRWELTRLQYNNTDQKTKDIIGIDLKVIDDYFLTRLLISYARSGRYRLINKDFKGARKDYKQAIFFQGLRQPIWRFRALTGWIFSFFGWDVEGLAKLVGKVTYS